MPSGMKLGAGPSLRLPAAYSGLIRPPAGAGTPVGSSKAPTLSSGLLDVTKLNLKDLPHGGGGSTGGGASDAAEGEGGVEEGGEENGRPAADADGQADGTGAPDAALIGEGDALVEGARALLVPLLGIRRQREEKTRGLKPLEAVLRQAQGRKRMTMGKRQRRRRRTRGGGDGERGREGARQAQEGPT